MPGSRSAVVLSFLQVRARNWFACWRPMWAVPRFETALRLIPNTRAAKHRLSRLLWGHRVCWLQAEVGS
eukprot:9718073-Alexandrium_andersonii.AAC.1